MKSTFLLLCLFLITSLLCGQVTYEAFGATGDGETDDLAAIAAAHDYANLHQLSVSADDDATYYLGGKRQSAVIRTNTDFGTAKFIIDDREVEDRSEPIFLVDSERQSVPVKDIASLARNQELLDFSLDGPALVTVTDTSTRQYIRYGLNQNNGAAKTDIFLIDARGRVDEATPIIWDFDRIASISALPMDTTEIRITGGRFTTIANQAESKYTYYDRNITVRRSNVVIDGLEHRVTGEGEQGAPYGGFIKVQDCANVTVKNCTLTGHKMYSTIGSAGKPVNMGTYDIIVNRSLNVTFENCEQTNDISDRTYWGIMGSNYSKNLVFDGCVFSRFDAHKGVANATIRNSTLGHMGINAIGTGTFTVENTTVRSRRFINLRPDYGSTWEGEVIIRNCTFAPPGSGGDVAIIGGHNTGHHDFGYTAFMPELITIEGLRIEDGDRPEDYEGPAIFANFNPERKDKAYREEFPYVLTREVILKGVTTASGRELRVSGNTFMFQEVVIKR